MRLTTHLAGAPFLARVRAPVSVGDVPAMTSLVSIRQ